MVTGSGKPNSGRANTLMFLILDAKSVTDRREREGYRNASGVLGPDTRRVEEQPFLGLEGCSLLLVKPSTKRHGGWE